MAASRSFVELHDSIPNWITRLDLLSRQVNERYAEFTRLSRSSIGSIGSIRRKKTGSTESLRPQDEAERGVRAPESSEPPHERIEIDPNNWRLFQDAQEQSQAKRKRKSSTILSVASGPQRFRSRMSLIVYYDSAIQQGFEWLVRSIAGARNTLRKAKTSASLKSRVASLEMEESPFEGSRTDAMLRNPNLPRLPRGSGPYMTDGISFESYDLIDKDLEAAQSLCERGAHQFLRDGTCTDELSGTREKFENCLRIAEAQIASTCKIEENTMEAEWEPKDKDKNDINYAAYDSIKIDDGDPHDQAKADAVIAVDEEQKAPIADAFGLGVGAIEIDDQDDSGSFHIDLSAFRRTR